MSICVHLQAPVLYQGVAGSLSPESTLVSRGDASTPDSCIACIDLPSPRVDTPCRAAFGHETMPMTQPNGQCGCSACVMSPLHAMGRRWQISCRLT